MKSRGEDGKMKELALIKLGERLALDVEGIQTVKLACENPKQYFKTFKHQLEERSITKISNDLPLIALVDELIEKELAHEIDWKESIATICEVVDRLVSKKKLLTLVWAELNAKYSELYAEEALVALALELQEKEISLAHLDIDSDSYVLITVRKDEIEELKGLAQQAGFTILDEFV